jgi:hypothetical protein
MRSGGLDEWLGWVRTCIHVAGFRAANMTLKRSVEYQMRSTSNSPSIDPLRETA